jgi:thiol-disulfide isomerase/thioredoxin
MSEVQKEGTQPPPSRGRIAGAVLGLILVAAALYGAIWLVAKSGHGGDLKPLAAGAMSKLVVADKSTPTPALTAEDAQGRKVTLADFKGRVLVVNLWATWCAPCQQEMPTLAKLQAAYAGQNVAVAPISLDKGDEDIAKAKAFLAGLPPLKYFHGPYDLAFQAGTEGLPTTLIYDRSGRLRATLTGGADWSTPEARAVLDRLLSQKD